MKIDAGRLKQAVKDRGLTLASISKRMGFEQSYFSAMLRKGEISNLVVSFLQAEYGIETHEYACLESGRPSEMSQGQLEKSIMNVLKEYEPIDYERLYKVIGASVREAIEDTVSEAVYAAVKKAWAE